MPSRRNLLLLAVAGIAIVCLLDWWGPAALAWGSLYVGSVLLAARVDRAAGWACLTLTSVLACADFLHLGTEPGGDVAARIGMALAVQWIGGLVILLRHPSAAAAGREAQQSTVAAATKTDASSAATTNADATTDSQELSDSSLADSRSIEELSQLHEEEIRKTRVLASIMDDLRREREKLKASEERFRSTVESAPMAIVMVDQSGKIVLLNSEAEQLFGYSRSEALGHEVEMLLPERYRGEHVELRADFLGNAQQRRMGAGRELYALHKDGREVPVEIGLNPVATAEGIFVLSAIADVSERKLAEADLRERREFLDRVTDIAPTILYVFDLRTSSNIWINSNIFTTLGFSADEIQAYGTELLSSLLHPDDLQMFGEHLAEIRRMPEDRIVECEYRIRHQDGSWRWLECRDMPYARDEHGEVTQILGAAYDITDRKQWEALLHERDARIQGLLDSTAEGIYTINLSGKCSLVNASAARILGYESASDLLGRNMHGLIHGRYPDGTPYPPSNCPILQAVTAGEPVHVEDEFFWRADGTMFPVEYWSHPIVLGMQVTGAVVTFLDITERRRAERDRAFHSAMVDSSYDAIIGKNSQGIITSWNSGAEAVYGYTRAEAIGNTIGFVLPAGIQEEEPEIQQAVEQGEGLQAFEVLRRRKDGRVIPVSITLSPIHDAAGAMIGTSSIERDITERKRTEAELLRAKETAERANQARAEFLANVSHELRTPMNAIIGMTQLALGEELSAELRDYISTANDSAHALLALLNDILDFSKLEAGRFTIEYEPFSLRALLDDTVKTLAVRAFENGIEFACEFPRGGPDDLVGDPVRLRQVLTNLISNAVKFTDTGEVHVCVRVVEHDDRKCQLQFSVRDTGIGIPLKYHRRILEPFTQVDPSPSRRYGGTGLGLAICNELISAMGGTLQVESEPDRGSCFSFELGFEPAPAAPAPVVDAAPLASLRHERVLLIVENETNRRILTEMLESWSIQVEPAADGTQALAKFAAAPAEAPFRLLVLDAIMPRTDGFDLLHRLHEIAAEVPPAIVMVSTTDRRTLKDRPTPRTRLAYAQKPVSQSHLLESITRLLSPETEDQPPPELVIQPTERRRSLAVLLAEDTVANQKVVLSILGKRGHRVTVAENGREAVEQYAPGKFDVILMDIQMPLVDGLQATQAIRQMERGAARQTPIIAMTAHAMRGDKERCLAAGMNGYIAKPINVHELLALTERFGESYDDATGAAVRKLNESDELPDGGVDLNAALARLDGDGMLLQELVALFLTDAPTLWEQLQQAVTQGDAAEAEHTAHSLKGLAANFNAKRCAYLAGELEVLAERSDFDSANEVLHALGAELQAVYASLRAASV